MTQLFSYSFSLAPDAPAKPRLHDHAYNEFVLSLSDGWRPVPVAQDRTVAFHSATQGAGVTVSADFFDIPADKAQAMAEKALEARFDALQQATPTKALQVLKRSLKPHSGGSGLELFLAVEAPEEHVTYYLGYVTSRKVLHLTLVCKPDRAAASVLFDEVVGHFRPKLP